jgi:hypothetical protein
VLLLALLRPLRLLLLLLLQPRVQACADHHKRSDVRDMSSGQFVKQQ